MVVSEPAVHVCHALSRELAEACRTFFLVLYFFLFLFCYSHLVCCACVRKPPQIKFKLDFGKALGSAYTAKAVRLWLDPFLRETLADLIVWPNRIVVPILPENVTGPLDDLMLRYDKPPCCHRLTHLVLDCVPHPPVRAMIALTGNALFGKFWRVTCK